MSAELHVLFGAGQVGKPLARLLLEAGKRVRIAKRSPAGAPPGAEVIQGDASDPAFCVQAAQGAATVCHCMNPPYDARTWAELVPRYMDNLIAAAGRAGARFVVLDNVYMLGRSLDEDTPRFHAAAKGRFGHVPRSVCSGLIAAATCAPRRGARQISAGRAVR
jgi:uncharacterized protein YbjT (DUF2867 family)